MISVSNIVFERLTEYNKVGMFYFNITLIYVEYKKSIFYTILFIFLFNLQIIQINYMVCSVAQFTCAHILHRIHP